MQARFSWKSFASRTWGLRQKRVQFPFLAVQGTYSFMFFSSPGREEAFGTNLFLPVPPAPTSLSGELLLGAFPFSTVSDPF